MVQLFRYYHVLGSMEDQVLKLIDFVVKVDHETTQGWPVWFPVELYKIARSWVK